MSNAVYTLWLRAIKKHSRSKVRILSNLGMPFFFLLFLGLGLNSVFNFGGVSYIGFILPGIIALSLLMSSMTSGIQILFDKQFGFLKETLVAPVSRIQIMLGQTLGGATTTFFQGVLLFLVSLILGVRVQSFFGLVIAFFFMILVSISFTALGIAAATKMRDMQSYPLIWSFVIFPLFFLSGALFPIGNLPAWIRWLAYVNPLTYGVEGIRYGLLGISNISLWVSLDLMILFTLFTVVFGASLFNKTSV